METDKGTDIKNIDITLDKNDKNNIHITFQVETNQVTQKNTLTTFDFDLQIELNKENIKISPIVDKKYKIVNKLDDENKDGKFYRSHNSYFAHFMHELLNNKLKEDNNHETLIALTYGAIVYTFDFFSVKQINNETEEDGLTIARINKLLSKLIQNDFTQKYKSNFLAQLEKPKDERFETTYNEIKKLIDELSNKQSKGNDENIVNNNTDNGNNNNIQTQLEGNNNNNLPECCNNCITGLQNLWNKIKCW